MNTSTCLDRPVLRSLRRYTLTSLLVAALAALVLCAPRAGAATDDCWEEMHEVWHESVVEIIWCEPSGHWEIYQEVITIWQEDPEGWIEVVIYGEVWVEDPGHWEEVVSPGWWETVAVTVCP